jgi:membrane-associated phospholipid phosphatase
LYFSMIIYLMILYKVIPLNYINELYYFFVGLLIATFSTLLLLFTKIKVSIHLMGMGSVLIYLIGLSIHFEVNITFAIALFTLMTGLVATSRLYMKAHNKVELLLGFLVGFCSQLFVLKYWL